jgi:hypothetical protein
LLKNIAKSYWKQAEQEESKKSKASDEMESLPGTPIAKFLQSSLIYRP